MNLWIRFARFNIVGALGIGVQLAAVWLLADVAHLHYIAATGAAVAIAVAHNFVWHWWWTWRDRTQSGGRRGRFVRFAAANGALSFVGNLGMVATLVSGARVSPVAANAIGIVVCGVLNFWLGDAFVFPSVEQRSRFQ